MSIRVRLIVMCLLMALLPAVPLAFVVQSLLDKSFSVGLNDTMEDALRGAVTVSRDHFDSVLKDFQEDVHRLSREISPSSPADSTTAVEVLLIARTSGAAVHGVLAAPTTRNDGRGRAGHEQASQLPEALLTFAGNEWFQRFTEGRTLVAQSVPAYGDAITFFIADDRTLLLASWREQLLFYHQIDPFFVEQSRHMISARQLFAKLRLTRGDLSRSFFLSFVIIYGACLLLALAVALTMAQRLSRPIRQLAAGADRVAEGDWSTQINVRADGETARLVDAFNKMVSRLDEQRQHIAETEKMAAWRDVARHLAHEIKNPLLPIRLTIEELRDQYRGTDAKYRDQLGESVRVVGEELGRLQRLVREFSEFARMPELSVRLGSFETLVRDVCAMYPQLATKVTCAGTVPELTFDSDQMRRVVVNLFDNAVSVGARALNISLDVEGGMLRATFSDDGPGISPEHLGKVFEPYFTTRAEGTGLGLAMSRNVVTQHGGRLEVSGTSRAGATFVLILPLDGPRSSETPAAAHPTVSEEVT